MASTNILKFNEANNSDLTQNDNTYSANTTRKNGIQAGIADPTLHNKLFFQTSVMAYALAQFIVGQGYDCIDSADPTITLNIANSINALVAKNNVNIAVNSLIWQANTKVAAGQFIIDAGIPVGCLAVVTTAGTTGSTKPSWTAQGASVTDNTAVWQIQSVNTLKSKVLGPVGKTQPTLTALVDWDTMKVGNGGLDVRYTTNTLNGINGYGGDSLSYNYGDILLKQDFSTFDALLIDYANDACNVEDFIVIPMWLFLEKFNTKGIFYLVHSTDMLANTDCTNIVLPSGIVTPSTGVRNQANHTFSTLTGVGNIWGCWGANNTVKSSTKTRLNIVTYNPTTGDFSAAQRTSSDGLYSLQNCTIIEIYGVTY